MSRGVISRYVPHCMIVARMSLCLVIIAINSLQGSIFFYDQEERCRTCPVVNLMRVEAPRTTFLSLGFGIGLSRIWYPARQYVS